LAFAAKFGMSGGVANNREEPFATPDAQISHRAQICASAQTIFVLE
jgi:hypothetical protein